MISRIVRCVAVAGVLSAAAGPAGAQAPTSAVTPLAHLAAKVKPGHTLLLTLRNGSTDRGTLQSIDVGAGSLILGTERTDGGVTRFTTHVVNVGDIETAQFRSGGHFKPSWMLRGTLGGAVAGGIIGAVGSTGSSDTGLQTAAGVILGGACGLFLGAVVPLSFHHTHTIAMQ